MAKQDFRDAQQNFAQGNVFGGLSELSEAKQHMPDGLSHMDGGRGWICQSKQAVPKRPQVGGTRLAARSTSVPASDKNFSTCAFLLRRCSRFPLVALSDLRSRGNDVRSRRLNGPWPNLP